MTPVLWQVLEVTINTHASAEECRSLLAVAQLEKDPGSPGMSPGSASKHNHVISVQPTVEVAYETCLSQGTKPMGSTPGTESSAT